MKGKVACIICLCHLPVLRKRILSAYLVSKLNPSITRNQITTYTKTSHQFSPIVSLECFLWKKINVESDVFKMLIRLYRRDAERLSRDENLSLFTFGHHLQLVLYLSKTSPIHHTTQVRRLKTTI